MSQQTKCRICRNKQSAAFASTAFTAAFAAQKDALGSAQKRLAMRESALEKERAAHSALWKSIQEKMEVEKKKLAAKVRCA